MEYQTFKELLEWVVRDNEEHLSLKALEIISEYQWFVDQLVKENWQLKRDNANKNAMIDWLQWFWFADK